MLHLVRFELDFLLGVSNRLPARQRLCPQPRRKELCVSDVYQSECVPDGALRQPVWIRARTLPRSRLLFPSRAAVAQCLSGCLMRPRRGVIHVVLHPITFSNLSVLKKRLLRDIPVVNGVTLARGHMACSCSSAQTCACYFLQLETVLTLLFSKTVAKRWETC